MKLIKLVYIAHGWYLGINGKTLIDENPEAWRYGPVIASLYHKYKKFGDNRITDIPNECNLENKEDERFLDRIWDVYGGDTALELSAKTHKYDTPWSRVWNSIKDGNYYSLQIPESYIRDYYRRLYLANKAEAQVNV